MKTKDKIIHAAKEVFHKKGFAGARMQEIADASGVNKALLHYHFNSKEELFRSVLIGGVVELFPILMATLNSNMTLREKIPAVVSLYIGHLSKNPELPGFVINELNQNPGFVQENLKGIGAYPNVLISQIEEAVAEGEIIETDPFQFIVSIIGLCVFPFIGKPMIQFMSGKNDAEFKLFIENRKAHVETLLLNGLFCKDQKN